MTTGYKFDKENHIHSLDGRPLMGTSTVVGVIAKPLTWWASGLAVTELGWSPQKDKKKKPIPVAERLPIASKRFSEIKDLTDEQYLKLLDKAYRAHADTLTKSADKGTDMHAELEDYVKFCITETDGVPAAALYVGDHEQVSLFDNWATDHVKRFFVSEGYCYSRKLWTGGITDLLFEDTEGRLALMDFKSSKDAYLSQFFQIAGYDIAISENGLFDSDGHQTYGRFSQPIEYYAVFPFGMTNPEPQFHHDTAGAREGFKAAVVLHKLINS